MLDMSWYGSDFAKNAANDLNLPYVRVDVSISPFLKFLEKYLDYRNSSDVVIVFDDSQCKFCEQKVIQNALRFKINRGFVDFRFWEPLR